MEEKYRVYLLGVLRASDRAALASYASDGSGLDVQVLKELVATRQMLEPERRNSVEGQEYTIHFVADNRGLVYCAVTNKGYPMRVAFTLLDEMRSSFISQHESAVLTAKDSSLTRQCKSAFKDLMIKYQQPEQMDKVLSVQSKIDVVKSQMQESIAVMLQNDERLDSLQVATEGLTQQARIFETRTTQLRRKIQWEALRLKCMFGLLICVVLAIIITPIVLHVKRKSHH